MDGLTAGRMVHFVMPNGDHRPAIVTQVFSGENGMANLNVITDYNNDTGWNATLRQQIKDAGLDPDQIAHGHVWATSRMYSEEPKPGTWHWIEKA